MLRCHYENYSNCFELFLWNGWLRKICLVLFLAGTTPVGSQWWKLFGTQWAGFKPTHNPSSGSAEWNCLVVMPTTPQRYIWSFVRRSTTLHKVADIYFNLKAFMSSLYSTCCLFRTLIVACYTIWIMKTPQR